VERTSFLERGGFYEQVTEKLNFKEPWNTQK
jgi:hypothetical protein